ncbi:MULTISPECIES: YlxR family protein [unclassified Rothia (in: high G+C Gram-positive bacteria)]|uniref:YlxR family protein n=1 Tax=unclassified Rothia (in: high G+C Gram-positive bacteria) TaxID=2689056 RepID=UPI00195C0291|nr:MULTISPECIES: YlxR family protein [unclassified Rothia (in: high G+C Gram-positive bacteria)]MBM7051312.1 YlxR family protein [Rothia sp. ZJ1223]QRZ61103.1 YlxR family protein [Rothia sp. ZJ932]
MQENPQQVTALTAVPVRTCIGCRTTDSRGSLLRVALKKEATGTPVVFLDTAKRASGRGAWVHPNPQCFATALKRGSFNKAFRARVNATHLENIPTGELVESLDEGECREISARNE